MERYGFHALNGTASMFVFANSLSQARKIKDTRVRQGRDVSGNRLPSDDEQADEPVVIDSPEMLYQG